MKNQRKLAAIMFTDICGYSALMSKDEKLAMGILQKNRSIHKTAIAKFNGEYIKEIGDGTLAIFQSSLDAVHCASRIRKLCCKESSFTVRIGIHIGDIVFRDGDVFGDGVNIASRIEASGQPGGIFISERVYEDIKNKPGIRAEFYGRKFLKNIPDPVNIYQLLTEGEPQGKGAARKGVRVKTGQIAGTSQQVRAKTSLIEGYGYDIFISFRQKDNKYDGWVTEFVENLKKELEATFKEEVSVYFDIKPHDGPLETHDVDASLKEKLKCLVFIPVISRTYCDPKSYTWEHEFKAFIEQASQDQFGLKVKLPNGNVASRVLPVRIHDLESRDLMLCESALGESTRGVEFIYSKPGINRPLKPDDDEKTNIYATRYRDQINKVANSINEIISGLKGESLDIVSGAEPVALSSEKPPAKEKSIIVLPFENISNDPEQEYFSDGLTEEIITDLSHIQDLLVISRNSAMAYKGARKKTAEIAIEMNVKYVLEGSVRKAGDRIRITAQLINASDGYLLWSERFDRGMGDIFDIQDELTLSIVNHLKVTLKAGEKAILEKHCTKDAEAYALYLKGLYFYARTSPESYEKALNCFQAAIVKDPDFAQAYAGMGQVFAGMGVYSFAPPAQMLQKAKAALLNALSLDENLAEAHAVTASLAYWFEWDWEAAGRNFDRALALNPGDAMTHAIYSLFLVTLKRPDDAIREIKKAIELDPLMPLYYAWSIMVHNCAWRFDEALREFTRAMEIDPNNGLAFFHVGASWFGKGLLDKAIETWEKGGKFVVFPGYSEGNLGIAYMLKGDRQKSERILAEMIEQKKTIKQTSSVYIAWVAGNLGKLDLAFEFLDLGYEERDIMMTLVNVVTEFYCPPMLTDPRFKALLARMKLDFIP